MGFNLPVLNRRRRLLGTAAFSPTRLFALAEPGVWYDPSDVANLDWRRNLLTYTEQFDNAAWTKSATTIVADAATAPNGTTTADRVVSTAVNTFHDVRSAATNSLPASACVLTAYVKASGYNFVEVGVSSNSSFTAYSTAVIDLTNGANAGTGVSLTWTTNSVSVQNVGSGWYRVSLAFTPNAATTTAMVFTSPLPTSTRGVAYTGDGTSGILIWGAQLELGSTATDYQRISDVNTEVIERFPTATLFTDTAGTQPVTTPGQTVALALDKSKGLVRGPELVTNGGFSDGTTGWTSWQTGILSVDSSRLKVENGAATISGAYQIITVVVGRTYKFEGVREPGPGAGSPRYYLGTSIGGTQYVSGAVSGQVFVAVSTTLVVTAATQTTTLGAIAYFDNISVRELPGFHATQATAASRPTYGVVPRTGRRNLLTFSEQFDNAAWSTSTMTKTANIAVAPDGTTTADRLTCAVTAAENNIRFTSSQTNATAFTFSCYVKAGSSGARLYLRNIAIDGGSTNGVVQFNPENGTVSLTYGSTYVGNASMTDVGGGWYRCRISGITLNPVVNNFLDIGVTNGATATGGVIGAFVDIWGAQLELGSTATAYQRVGAPSAVSGLSFDVTEAGVQSLSYLWFDGTDDFLITPTITPGVDKAQVFAGVRKLSDAARGTVLELSADIGTNNGTILLEGPAFTPATDRYRFISKGTTPQSAIATSSTFAAPVTNVLTGLGDISGDVSRLRINGTVIAESLGDQGTGNFLAYPLYIGRRGGTLNPFNGQIFSLIVRFGANLDAATISNTEVWVGGKTQDMFAPVITGVPTIGVA